MAQPHQTASESTTIQTALQTAQEARREIEHLRLFLEDIKLDLQKQQEKVVLEKTSTAEKKLATRQRWLP